jgi:hypothetical protein
MVELKIPRRTPSFVVPAEALIFNRNGMQVAVVSNGKAEICKVRVARDLGTRVEPVNLVDGSNVQPHPDGAAPNR